MRFLPILVVGILVGCSSAAFGDAEVSPDWHKPKVVIEADRVEGGPPPVSVQPITDQRPPTPPPPVPPDYSAHCRVDEVIGLFGCQNPEPDPLGRPALTEADIRRAVEEIGLPRLKVRIQPGSTTLVNVATIFSTEPEEFDHSVFLLGYNIDLIAEPQRFDWRYGDGTLSSSADPGRPYPAMDVSHAYLRPAEGIRPSVDVTYRVTYRVDGGTWQALAETITAEGPATTLDVKEAVPVLAKR